MADYMAGHAELFYTGRHQFAWTHLYTRCLGFRVKCLSGRPRPSALVGLQIQKVTQDTFYT